MLVKGFDLEVWYTYILLFNSQPVLATHNLINSQGCIKLDVFNSICNPELDLEITLTFEKA